jgi:hypothetical protein
MKLYEYMPEKNKTRLNGIIIILIAVAALMFLTPMIFTQIPFSWVPQFLGMIALVAVIFIITRYIAKSFIYTVWQNDDGTLDLTVCELINGKKRTTVCRIGLGNITEAHLLYPEKSDDKIKEKQLSANARAARTKSFDYCHDIKASPVCIILVEECGEQLLIKLSPDEELYSYLKSE